MVNKSSLRQDYVRRRQAIESSLRQVKDAAILQQVIDGVNWSNINRLHVYQSRTDWGEVDTGDIIKQLSIRHPSLTIDTAGHQPDTVQPGDSYDVIIIPTLAYDNHRNRLGMGQGWYDRFLASQPEALKIGLAYTESFIDNLPVEPHDQALDVIYSA